MSTSRSHKTRPLACDVRFTNEELVVGLTDGRTLLVPLSWFPRLLLATPVQRNAWELIGRGGGIHWEDLDEDISVSGLIEGRRSAERGDISAAARKRAIAQK